MRSGARALLAVLAALAAACGSGGSSASPSPVPAASPIASPAPGPGFEFRAMAHVSWWHDGYQQAAATDARRALAATRSNWGAVLVTWYMDRRDSILIAPDDQQTPTDAAVVAAIRDLHALGLKVMLKPHVDVKDGSWRGTIRPSDTSAWFSSYDAFVSRYARMAQTQGVELFDVGTELVTLSDFHFASDWGTVIGHVRGVYAGPLTYGANANSAGDEFTSVSFWDRLDYAGLDVYAPLTDHDNPTHDELVRAWSGNVNGDDMVAAYKNWQAGHGKPVLFTEIGYRSAAGANRYPWDFTRASSPDVAEQANCYEAAFEVWSQETAWLRGTFWWAWPVDPANPGDTDYSPRGKPAEGILVDWYSR
jgi:glycosyl hydrolase family 113